MAHNTTYDPTNVGNRPGDGPLRAGGVHVTETGKEENNLPSTLSQRAKMQMAALRIVRDCAAGPDCIRDCGATYLPKDPGEDTASYKSRLERSVFFNVFGKTIDALTGFVFSKDPTFGDDVPPAIVEHWENIDNSGTHGDVFLREQFTDGLIAGHNGILVEFPMTGGTQTPMEEVVIGEIRPYWVPVMKDNIVSWRTTMANGQATLSQLVLKECMMVPDGAFGEKEQTTYRVLHRDPDGTVWGELLQVNEDKTVTILDQWTYPTQDEIPFAEVITSGRCGLLESKPPLLDLAFLNIAHYQTWSDRAVSAHKTCVPIWVECGTTMSGEEGGGPIVVGPNSARVFSDPAAKAGYQSHDGAALAEVTKIIEEIKSDMSIMGLQMLAPNKRAAETAEAKRIDKSASDSSLGVAARGLQDGVERALYFHARYLQLSSGGSIEINRDFENNTMSPELMTAYATLAEKLSLPVRVILEELQKGGRIADDVDLDELEREMEANAMAKAEEEATRLAMEAEQMPAKPPMAA